MTTTKNYTSNQAPSKLLDKCKSKKRHYISPKIEVIYIQTEGVFVAASIHTNTTGFPQEVWQDGSPEESVNNTGTWGQ
ncbi:MAG: hypothetical protein QM654_16210 [Dysgonamonadaceae bacterium]